MFAFYKYNDISLGIDSCIWCFLFHLVRIMKKSLLSLAGIMGLSIILCWVVSAQLEISDLFYDGTPQVDGAHSKLLNDYENTWWYTDSTAINCEVNNGITITIISFIGIMF